MPTYDDTADLDTLRNILRSTTEAFGTPGHVTHDLLAQILSRSSQAFVIGYPDGSLGMMNEAFERLTGYTAEELRTISWATTLTPPEWREFERLKVDELSRTGQPVRYEKEYIRKDGTRIPIELHVHLVPDTQGIYYYTFLTDISERKNVEEALRQSEERLRSVLENATDFVYRFNYQSGCFDYVSPSSESVTTYTAADYMSMDIAKALDLVHPEDSETFRATVSSLQPGVKTVVEYRLRTKTGDYRWISNHLTLIQDNATGAVYRYGSVRNITDEKIVRETLKNTTDLLTSVLDTSPDCVYRYNLQTNTYDYFSPASAIVLGHAPAELREMGPAAVHSFVHPDDREAVLAAIRRLEASGREEIVYRRFVNGRGYCWLSHQFALVKDGAGLPRYRFGSIRDVTDRVWREQRDQFLIGLTERTQYIHDHASILAEVLRSVGTFLNVNRCTYLDVDEANGLLHVKSEWLRDGTTSAAGTASLLDLDEADISSLKSRRPIIVCDSKDNRIRFKFLDHDASSLIYVPIHREGRWMSMLTVSDLVPRTWTEGEIALLKTVAERSRLKVENVRLIEELRLQSERAKYLSEASAALNASLDHEATLATIAKLAVPRFADWCIVDMADQATGAVQHVALEHVDPAKVALGWELRARYPSDLNVETGLGRVLYSGESTFIPLVSDEMIRAGSRDDAHYQLLKELGLSSVMIVPLAIRDHVFGTLSLIAAKESGRMFTEEDLRVAEDIGLRAGLAIENSRLYRQVQDEALKQRRIADTLQMSLMVSRSLIDFDGFVADTHYEAAIDESLIGGDFGDVFRIDESRVALIIGDCTGKGLDAARFVGECQFATRAFIRETPDEPAQVLSRVNRMLLDDQRFDGRPITALACMTIAVIDTLTGAVRIAVGGSEPPIIYRNQEKIAEEVQVRSPMLGIQDDMTFAVLDLQLQDGDVLALTTDGITEARDQETRALFGYPRLLQSVQEIGSSQPAVAGFAERIATAAKCFASSHLTDDACVIVGKWHRPAGD